MAGQRRRLPWYYRIALRTYPRPFRDAYGVDLGRSLRDELRDGAEGGGGVSRLIDLFVVGLLERFTVLTRARGTRGGPGHLGGPSHGPGRQRGSFVETVWQDLRYAVRTLRKAPGLTTVAVATLALAIGGTTAIFSVVNTVLLEPFPFPEADRLVFMWQDDGQVGSPHTHVSPPNYRDWRDQSSTFETMGALAVGWAATITGDGEPERLEAGVASSDLFRALKIAPLLGRTFTPEEDVAGSEPVAVLSHGFWQRRFGADPEVVGRRIQLDGVTYTVVGVMPASFDLPEENSDIFLPFSFLGRRLGFRFQRFLWVIGRMAPDVTLEQAYGDVAAVARGLEDRYPDTNRTVGVTMVPFHDRFVGEVRTALWMLLGAGVFVLLIGCANVANLMLTRASARSGELAVRVALGAGKGRIARQLATEGLVLAAAAAVVGLALAQLGLTALVGLSPGGIPRLDEVGIDARVLAFTAVVSTGVALLVGVAPTLTASWPNVTERLKGGGRGATAGSSKARLRNALSGLEISLAAMLLIGGGLLIRSYRELRAVDPGFTAEGVVTAAVVLPSARYSEPAVRQAFFTQLLERIEALPGVVSVGGINQVPILEPRMSTRITIVGAPPLPPDQLPDVGFYRVTTDYFRTMGVPLVAGRGFNAEDNLNAGQAAAIVNETFAERYYPGADAVDNQFRMGSDESAVPWTIVGVVRSMRRSDIAASPDAEFYYHYLQSDANGFSLAVKVASDPTGIIGAVRSAVRELDPGLPISDVHRMDQVLVDAVAQERFTTVLLMTLAGLALALAVVGVYGVISVNVSQRTAEIAVRMAFGADGGSVLRLVVGQGFRLAAVAVGIGLIGALALSRFLRAILFGVSPTDPATYAGVAVLLLAFGALAAYVPARRATRIDPMAVLRSE